MTTASRRITGALLLTVVGLAACSDSSGPSTTPLSPSNADEVGAAMVSTADLAAAAVAPGIPAFGGGFGVFSAARIGRSFAPPASGSDCAEVSDLTDTDEDGVPDDATWTFTAANCTQTDIEGNRTVVTGSVVLSDPGLTAGYDLRLNALTSQYYENGASAPLLQSVLTGDWSLRATSDAITLGQDYAFTLTIQNQSVTLTNDLAVGFAVATGNNIAWGSPLPDGTLSIDGAWRVSSSRETYALTLLTSTPLTYDDECLGIVAGALDAQGSGGTVRVTWNGCGDHTTEFLPD